jgi:hypothetical protein
MNTLQTNTFAKSNQFNKNNLSNNMLIEVLSYNNGVEVFVIIIFIKVSYHLWFCDISTKFIKPSIEFYSLHTLFNVAMTSSTIS